MESSLRAYDRVADRIRLHRQVDKRSVILVEGPADRRLVKRLVADRAAVVFMGNTRDDVLAAARDSVKLGLDRVVCVVDRDFDDAVADAKAEGLPVVGYDGADLEDMLAHSPSLDRLLGELAKTSSDPLAVQTRCSCTLGSRAHTSLACDDSTHCEDGHLRLTLSTFQRKSAKTSLS